MTVRSLALWLERLELSIFDLTQPQPPFAKRSRLYAAKYKSLKYSIIFEAKLQTAIDYTDDFQGIRNK